MTNHWLQGGHAKSSDVNAFMAVFAEKQREANRIEAQFDKLRDRCVGVGSDELSAEEESAVRCEMDSLSKQYRDLTGLSLH